MFDQKEKSRYKLLIYNDFLSFPVNLTSCSTNFLLEDIELVLHF
jgi:hypothetical protein